PERVVSIAEVRVGAAEQEADPAHETEIAELAIQRHISSATALEEARPLDKVSPGDERADEGRNLPRVGRAVGVKHDDDVAVRGLEAGPQRGALPATLLLNDLQPGIVLSSTLARPHRPGDIRRPIGGPPVDDDHVV